MNDTQEPEKPAGAKFGGIQGGRLAALAAARDALLIQIATDNISEETAVWRACEEIEETIRFLERIAFEFTGKRPGFRMK